jgi:hypothetical protein
MRLSQIDFRAAMALVLADVERQHPSLLRVVESPSDPDLHAMLWDSSGAGTGVYLSHAGEGTDLVAEAAGQVQEAAFEALWCEGKSTSWPTCPRHRETHPLSPDGGHHPAVWVCPTSKAVIANIGSLRDA